MNSESPRYAGRAIVALATDADVMRAERRRVQDGRAGAGVRLYRHRRQAACAVRVWLRGCLCCGIIQPRRKTIAELITPNQRGRNMATGEEARDLNDKIHGVDTRVSRLEGGYEHLATKGRHEGPRKSAVRALGVADYRRGRGGRHSAAIIIKGNFTDEGRRIWQPAKRRETSTTRFTV